MELALNSNFIDLNAHECENVNGGGTYDIIVGTVAIVGGCVGTLVGIGMAAVGVATANPVMVYSGITTAATFADTTVTGINLASGSNLYPVVPPGMYF